MCDSVRTKKTVRFTGVSELGEGGGGGVSVQRNSTVR